MMIKVSISSFLLSFSLLFGLFFYQYNLDFQNNLLVQKIIINIPQTNTEIAQKEQETLSSFIQENLDKYKKQKTHLIIDNNVDQKELYEMAKLSRFISNRYNVGLNLAEKIVVNAFLEGKKQHVAPLLILAVIATESNFQPSAKSSVGAIGLSQVLPHYHQAKIAKLKKYNLSIWSIPGNILVGSEILKEYLTNAHGNIYSALQMYNGSLGDESYKYSHKVLHHLSVLKYALKS
jgi:hypothetical protein